MLDVACGQPAGLYLLLPATLIAQVSGVLNAWYFLLPPPPRDTGDGASGGGASGGGAAAADNAGRTG